MLDAIRGGLGGQVAAYLSPTPLPAPLPSPVHRLRSPMLPHHPFIVSLMLPLPSPERALSLWYHER